MPRSQFAGRQVTLYLDTHADLMRWQQLAKPNTLNRWVIETVEASIDALRPKISSDEINQLRKENQDLKQANERLAARVNEVEDAFENSRTTPPHLDKSVVDLLLSGGSWLSSTINENLIITSGDDKQYYKFYKDATKKKLDRAKAINRTLEQLELVGLVKNTRSGWVWNKK